MAFVVKDRVKETSTTQGTSTFTLDGAATGFQSFSAIGDGNTTYYTIVGGSQWEVGIGIYTASGTTLSRDTVLASSNNGNLVNFSAGSKDVFVVYPAGRAVVVNGSTVEVPNSATLPISAGGTGSATASFSGANISGLNASNVSSGILALANGGTGSATASFSGANITSLNASNVTSGVLPLDHGGTGSATASFSGANITSLNASNVSTGILAIANGGTGSADATFSGANITSLNASNISTGTIANARTTASSANGASTIVARGASGEFSAGAVTTASVSGDGSGLTALNASNISSGTIANDRTTGSASNGAATLVLRGANGEFAAGAITGASFTGAGSALTSLNASNISSGTIANARTTATDANGASTIVARDASGNFSANTITATLNGNASTATSATSATSATTATTATNWGSYGAVPAAGTSFGNANTIGRSDANGYAYFNYINSNTSNSENPSVSQIIVTNGGDGFYRKASIAHLTGSLSGTAPISITGNAGSVNGYSVSTSGSANTIPTRNASGYLSPANWIQLDGTYGLYSPTNGAHFYVNNASYGSWRVAGSRNGWAGLEFDPPSGGPTTLMMNRDTFGFHMNDTGWRFYVSGASGYFPGNVVAYWSDQRLKENLRPIGSESLDIVSKISAYRFNWNEKVKEFNIPIEPGKEEIGLIAQEVQQVLPDAVVINQSAGKALPGGNKEKTDYLTINYDRITPILLQAINELRNRVEELENKIKSLNA